MLLIVYLCCFYCCSLYYQTICFHILHFQLRQQLYKSQCKSVTSCIVATMLLLGHCLLFVVISNVTDDLDVVFVTQNILHLLKIVQHFSIAIAHKKVVSNCLIVHMKVLRQTKLIFQTLSIVITNSKLINHNNDCKMCNTAQTNYHLQKCLTDVSCDTCKSWHLLLPIVIVQQNSCHLIKVNTNVVKCKMS